MSESNIITPNQIQNALDADPGEILRAIHKRIVDTEKLMGEYRNFAMNQQTDIEMLRERCAELKDRLDNQLAIQPLPLEIQHDLQTNMFEKI